jgi:hypothetical protein
MAQQKARVHSINWHIGDWTVKTRSLTPHARAALCMVWETMVARDGPFDYAAVDFAYSARMTDAEVTAAFDELQRKGLLKIDGRIVSADDCQREIDAAKKRMKVAADNGAKGGRPSEKTKPLKDNDTQKPIANPQLTRSLATANPQLSNGFTTTTTNHDHKPQTTTTNHEPKVTPSIDDDFVEWFAACPKRIDRARALKAYRTARKEVGAEVLLDGMKRYAEHCRVKQTEDTYIKHPTSWLNAKAWENKYGASTPSQSLPPPTQTATLKVHGATREDLEPQSEEERQKGLALFQQHRERQENARRDAADATPAQ